jgi:hypothetical protein
MYGTTLSLSKLGGHSGPLLAIIGSALLGTFLSAQYIEHITMHAIRKLIAALLIVIALGLGTGLL